MSSSFEKDIFRETELQIAIKECSMCGDLGMEKELFQCQGCLHRLQHRYCSKLYGHKELNDLICDWCLHERDSSHRNTRQRIEQGNSRGEPSKVVQQSPDNVNGKEGSSTLNTESINRPPGGAIKGNNENPAEPPSHRKGRGKDKIINQRYRYKFLADLLLVGLRI